MISVVNYLYEAKDKKVILWNKIDTDELALRFDTTLGFPADLKVAIKNNKPLIQKILAYNDIDSEEKARQVHYYKIPHDLKNTELSPIQQGIYLQNQLDQNANTYTVLVCIKIWNRDSEPVDAFLLEQAILAVLNKHPILRMTVMPDSAYEILEMDSLCIHKIAIKSEELDVYLCQQADHAFNLEGGFLVKPEIIEIIHATNPPNNSQSHQSDEIILNLTHHHMLTDAYSANLFYLGVLAAYKDLNEYKKGINHFNDFNYFDFTAFQAYELSTERYQAAIQRLVKKLERAEPLQLKKKRWIGEKNLEIELNNADANNADANAAEIIDFEWEYGVFDALKKLGIEHDLSLYALLMTAFYQALAIFNNNQDSSSLFPIGLTVSNRPYDLNQVIGPFINTLPLLFDYDSQKSFLENAKCVSDEIRYINEYNQLNLNILAQRSNKNTQEISQLMQVMFTMHNFQKSDKDVSSGVSAINNININNLQHEILQIHETSEKFGISVIVFEEEHSVKYNVSFAKNLYSRDFIQAVFDCYKKILAEVLVKSLHVSMRDINVLNRAEYQRIVYDWNATEEYYPRDKTIHQCFEEQVEKTPDNVAIVFENLQDTHKIQLTYRELNNKANQLAHYLRENYAIQPDDLIALCLDRSETMLIAILGVLKSGAAYVPMDPQYPEERIKYILEDTRAKVVLVDENGKSPLAPLLQRGEQTCGNLQSGEQTCGNLQVEKHSCERELVCVNLREIESDCQRYSKENPSAQRSNPTTVNTNHLAYVIYTSGTTGKPKGVMIEHRGIINRIYWMNANCPLTENDRVLHKTPYVFDVSVWELFWANWYGACIVIAKPEDHKSPEALQEIIVKEKISIIHFVPSMLGVFEESLALQSSLNSVGAFPLWAPFSHLKHIFCSGEALTLPQVLKCHELLPHVQIHNLYGPTEASVDVLYADCSDKNIDHITIGKPIFNTQAYILDSQLKALPIGAIGELYIGGDGLARGYLNQAELTAERFIFNPFVGENQRIYKTGDLACYLPDGNIEYIGRNDFQVKISGFRIELNEIENVLLKSHADIRHAVVMCVENSNQIKQASHYLLGYYVAPQKLDEEALLTYLSKYLPDYMLPKQLIRLTALPLTTNGKLDRKALPIPELISNKHYIAPRNNQEEGVCAIFAEVLNLPVEKVSIRDDFFQLGGDSIASIQIVSRLRQRLGLSIQVKDIFAYRTVERLSDEILSGLMEKLATGDQSKTKMLNEQGNLSGDFSLLPIQEWFFEQVENGNYHEPHHWNQSFLIKTPELDIHRLERALKQVVNYHDAFRLSYRKNKNKNHDGVWQQFYGETEPLDQPLKSLALNEVLLDQDILTDWQKEFSIEAGNLYSFGYIHGYPDRSARIYVAMHHLIVDAVSWHILLADLKACYDNQEYEFALKGTSYRQWVNVIRDYAKKNTDERVYWENILSSEESYLFDEKIPVVNSSAQRMIEKQEFTLDFAITQQLLTQCHHVYHTEINDLLLTSLGLALSEVTSTKKHLIMLEGHGREEIEPNVDIHHTMGWFTTMYPICVFIEPNHLGESIQNVKEDLRSTPNKGIGFGAIYGYKKDDASDKNNIALPSICFNYFGQIDTLDKSDWHIVDEFSGLAISEKNKNPFALNINAWVSQGKLHFSVVSQAKSESLILTSFVQSLERNLKSLINYLTQCHRSYLTPSDIDHIISAEYLESIQKSQEISAVYKANSLQQGFIYHALNQGATDDAYCVQMVFEYHKALSVDHLKRAWEIALMKFPSLRLRFSWTEDLVQIIDKKAELDWRYINLMDINDNNKNTPQTIADILTQDRKERYHLDKGRLFRIYCIQETDNQITCILSNHHAILDGWSYPVLLNYVHETYLKLLENVENAFAPEHCYGDVQKYLQSNNENFSDRDDFWKKEINGLGDSADLTGWLKPEKREIQLSNYKHIIDSQEQFLDITDELYQSLKKFTQSAGITFNAICQYVWHKLLHVYGNTSTTVVGTTVSGRALPINGIEQSVGLYINTLPLIIEHQAGQSVLEALNAIQEKINQLNYFSHVSLADLQSLQGHEEHDEHGQEHGQRLFDNLFMFENYPVPDSTSADSIQLTFIKAVEKFDYPLAIVAQERNAQLTIILKYAGELFDASMMGTVLAHFKGLLEQMVQKQDKKQNALNYLLPEEAQKIMEDWNATERNYSREKTIHQLFEEQVERTPDNVAVIFENTENKNKKYPLRTSKSHSRYCKEISDNSLQAQRSKALSEIDAAIHLSNLLDTHKTQLTYRELNNKANQLAHYLRETYDIQPDDLIGLCLDRSETMLIAILGVLKSGAAYVPMDPNYPEERIKYILDEIKAKVVLVNGDGKSPLAPLLQRGEQTCGNLQAIESCCEGYATENPNLQSIYAPQFNANNLAYVIYTSGTTGKPKGVMIEHRQVVSFFEGVSEQIFAKDQGTYSAENSSAKPMNTWLSVTNITFDISVLEILGSLIHGFQVVLLDEIVQIQTIQQDNQNNETSELRLQHNDKHMDFGLFYFGNAEYSDDKSAHKPSRYQLLLDGAKFADTHDFSSIWTPERHFAVFGGLYPNPTITSAAVAAITKNIHIRTGSLVLPLHNPIRVAEDWALIDNISQGRVGLSLATGWHKNDFALAPENFTERKKILVEHLETVQKLWQGESIDWPGVDGMMTSICTFPRPIQATLPIWLTIAGNPESFRQAGDMGVNVLTHLLGQTLDELAEKIKIYKTALIKANHSVEDKKISLMLHTFVSDSEEYALKQVKEPFKNYLKTSIDLMKAINEGEDLNTLSSEQMDDLLERAFVRYYHTSGLFGTPESCQPMIDNLKGIGITEIACLIDFGIPEAIVFENLEYLNQLRLSSQISVSTSNNTNVKTIADIIQEHQITHLQCTPSLAQLIFDENSAAQKIKLSSLEKILIGGEKMPESLADRIHDNTTARLYNMYGPTETTIWSLSRLINPHEKIQIGKPLPNEKAYVLNECLQALPVGAIGELYIGGNGLARGYFNQDELTAERFVLNPFTLNQYFYKTGDLVRYLPDGNIEFIGRRDFQVKIRGFRIELGEIEKVLLQCDPNINQSVVICSENINSSAYLLGYYVSPNKLNQDILLTQLSKYLPNYMIPTALIWLEKLPLMNNGKLDRKALPILNVMNKENKDNYVAPRNEQEKQIVAIFSEVLGNYLSAEKVGIRDDFFRLGGNSIFAIKLVTQLSTQLSLNISIGDLFKYKTIEGILDKTVNLTSNLSNNLENAVLIPRADSKNQTLSFAQERLWFIEQYESGSYAYNAPVVLFIKPEANTEQLIQAIQKVVARHDILHTFIKTSSEGLGYQSAQDLSEKPFYITQVTLKPEERANHVQQEIQHIFDLDQEYPIRISIFNEIGSEKRYLTLVVHHMAFDGWSLEVFLSDLEAYYYHAELPELSIQYKDFSVWQRDYFTQEHLSNQVTYWKNILERYTPLQLPLDKPRPARVSYAGAEVFFNVEEKVSQQLRNLAKTLKVSFYSILLSSYYLLLRSFSHQDDIIVGTPMANRHYSQLEPLIGFFVNTLALRSQINPEDNVIDYIQSVGKNVMEAQLHQDLPFEKLVAELGVEQDTSRHPLFQTLFSVQPFSVENTLLASHVESVDYTVAKFDLTLLLDDSQAAITGVFNYATRLFHAESIQNFARTYEYILEQIARVDGNINIKIQDVQYLNPEDYQKVVYDWNAIKEYYPKEKTIHQCFEEQVERTPDNIAIVFENLQDTHKTQLTYRELNNKANQLAHYWRENYAIQPDDLIALCLERSEYMLIAILGVLKSGAAYVPMDPSYPEERIQYILEDTRAKVVLVDGNGNGKSPLAALLQRGEQTCGNLQEKGSCGKEQSCVNLQEIISYCEGYSTENPEPAMSSNNLAYVIYTSGTTGNPKGVMQPHQNVIRLFNATHEWFHFNEKDTWTLFHSYVFDFSVWEMYGALLHGGKLVIPSEEQVHNLNVFYELCQSESITILNQTPTAFYQLIDIATNKSHNHQSKRLNSLRCIIFGGDALNLMSLKPWVDVYGYSQPKLINMYGITETTVHVTYKELMEDDFTEYSNSSHIGKAIPDLRMYLLDVYLNPLPVGSIGEMYVGGAGLAYGYLNLPELTESRFLVNPFQPNEKLYKTGDLARFLPDGSMEYIGRNDAQIKMRGYRIELGEIENILLQSSDKIRQACVVLNKTLKAENTLLAYYVAEQSLHEQYLLSYLETYLPFYMIPTALIWLEKLPLTINGKLDRRALPEPELTFHNSYIKPRNFQEEQVCAIFAEVLKLPLEKVGIQHDFFQLGGDSILAIRLLTQLKNQLHVSIRVLDIFVHRKIINLCEHIADCLEIKDIQQVHEHAYKNAIFSELKNDNGDVNIIDIYPASHLQIGMLLESIIHQGTYHDVFYYQINAEFHEKKFLAIWKTLIEKHDLLRARFIEHKEFGFVCEVVHENELEINDPSKYLRVLDKNINELINQEKAENFDCAKAGLFKLIVNTHTNTLKHTEKSQKTEKFDLIFSFHHAIADGWSIASLINEFIKVYVHYKPIIKAPVNLSYKAFVQAEFLAIQKIKNIDFWKGYLADAELIQVKQLLGRNAAAHVNSMSFDGAENFVSSDKNLCISSINLLEDETKRVHEFAKSNAVSIDSIFIYAYLATLAYFSNAQDITIGLVVNNRLEQEGGDELFGLFLNTIPYRFSFEQENTNNLIAEHISAVFNEKIKLAPYKNIPYGTIKSLFNRDLYECAFNFVHFHVFQDSQEDITDVGSYERSNIPFVLNVAQNGTFGFTLSIVAHDNVADQTQLNYFTHYLYTIIQRILDQKINTKTIKTTDLFYLTPTDHQKMIYDWNATTYDYPVHKTIHQLFEEQVERTPDNMALVFESNNLLDIHKTQLTYRELNQRANQLAHYLRENYAIQPDDLIALCLDRSEFLIIGILGVLKSGAAYVPMDPSYPEERIRYILEDTKAKVVLVNGNGKSPLAPLLQRGEKTCGSLQEKGSCGNEQFCANLQAIESCGVGYSTENPPLIIKSTMQSIMTSNNLAYVIYTSGTTGKPKGVMIEHRSLVNFALALSKAFGFSSSELKNCLFYANYVFDAHVSELFTAVIHGHKLYIPDNETRQDVNLLRQYINNHRIETATIPPILLTQKSLLSLKTLVVAGDTTNQKILDAYCQQGTKVINAYGPTESTVCATLHYYDYKNLSTNIGKPLENIQCYVLNKALQPLPLGVIGELYIGGLSLARGYLNQATLTSQRFVVNPLLGEKFFAPTETSYNTALVGAKNFSPTMNEYLYKTGDLVRYLPNGDLEFIKREDTQIKIRGFRIELAEIEQVLLQSNSKIQQVAVNCVGAGSPRPVEQGNGTTTYLLAYYVSSEKLDEALLFQYLSSHLPDYMIPTALVWLEQLPFTINGKLDKAALPIPELVNEENYVAPRNEQEAQVCAVFAEVLGITTHFENSQNKNAHRVGIRDDFFRLGGNSILAIKLMNQLATQLSLKISIADLFKYKTIEAILARNNNGTFDVAENLIIPKINISINSNSNKLRRIEVEQSLSFAQERLWFIGQYEGGSNVYNTPFVFCLKHNIDSARLINAIQKVVERHEILHTLIHTTSDGMGYQSVIDLQVKPFEVMSLTITQEKPEERQKILQTEFQHVFELDKEYPIRAVILNETTLGEKFFASTETSYNTALVAAKNLSPIVQNRYLCLVIHHMAFDGWSFEVFLNDLEAYYYQEILPELSIQYQDFSVWQRAYFTEEVLSEQIHYWKAILSDYTPLQLPLDKPRPSRVTYEGDDVLFYLNEEKSQQLRDLAKELKVSLYSVLLSAYYLLLRSFCHQDDIIVGTPMANRHYQQLEPLIGFFVNTLALRSQINPEDNLANYIQSVGQQVMEAQSHQDLPFEKLIAELGIEQDTSSHPLFQVLFTIQSQNLQDQRLLDLYSEPVSYSVAKYDITTMLDDSQAQITGVFNYATNLFELSTVQQFVKTYEYILAQIADLSVNVNSGHSKKITDLRYLNPEDYQRIMFDWNATYQDYPTEKTIHELFEEQVERTPDNIAIVFEKLQDIHKTQLTYRELNQRANQLAHYLRENYAIQPDDLIALCLDRSEFLIIAILGVLKSGAAYVPVDPSYPEERIKYILEDTRAKVILNNQWINNSKLLNIYSTENPNAIMTSDHLAYVIYTSGTTGNPKGVMIEHQSLVNLALTQGKAFGLESITDSAQKHKQSKNCLFYANYVFDAHVSELFTAIIHGHPLYILDNETRQDVNLLAQYIDTNHIQLATIPPVLLTKEPESLLKLETLVVAGDKTDSLVMQAYQKNNIKVINAYGPTESTVCATLNHYSKNDVSNNIGKPLGNIAYYVLDNDLNPLPIGAVGELYIGGTGLARGYLNQDELTADRFIWHAFVQLETLSPVSERLYKTGDLVRLLPDGKLLYIGRNDSQVKIHGHRIELSEIETALNKHHAIYSSVVKVNNQVHKSLNAYYISKKIRHDRLSWWPSVAEYYVYDDLLYSLMTGHTTRNEAYRLAIRKSVKDKIVVDIGTGPDVILSRICVEEGAKKVYAIEYLQETYNKAKQTIKLYHLEDKIHLILGDSRRVNLPEKCDVCVSEIVGSIGGSEGAAVILNDAKMRHLKSDGIFIPERSLTHMAAVMLPEDMLNTPYMEPIQQNYTRKIFEQTGYPFDLRLSLKGAEYQDLASDRAVLEDLVWKGEHFIAIEHKHEIHLTISHSGKIHGFLVWLDLILTEDNHIDILVDQESWLPIYFPAFPQGIAVSSGDKISGYVERKLCENQLNLDYIVTGFVHTSEGSMPFFYHSIHNDKVLNNNAFYANFFNVYNNYNAYGLDNVNLTAFLQQQLPTYMIPSAFIALESFPLTRSGKLDRKALPDSQKINTNHYVAPRNTMESEVCALYAEIFGLESGSIGIQDDFFKLGGDSILSIQMVSKLRQRLGLLIQVKDIFTYRTIERLYDEVLSKSVEKEQQEILSEQGWLSGSLGLLPIQQWFFDGVNNGNYAEPGHWNQSFLIKTPELDIQRLERALKQVISHHDALHLRYKQNDEGVWEQFYAEKSDSMDDLHVNLRQLDLNALRIKENILTYFNDWQKDFSLTEGNLYSFGYINGYADGSARVYVALHHLIVDVVSWRIFMEDLEGAYHENESLDAQHKNNQKGTSYRQWVNVVNDYREEHADEKNYWKMLLADKKTSEEKLKLFIEQDNESDNRHDITQNILQAHFILEQELTKKLLTEANHAYHTEMNDILLTALGLALHEITQTPVNHIVLEGHGREEIDPRVDITRTIGWFTTVYPVRLAVQPDNLSESIQAIKEHLRSIPNKGIGFKMGMNLDEAEATLPKISFNYLGQLDAGDEKMSLSNHLKNVQIADLTNTHLNTHWQIADEFSGISISSENQDDNIIKINGLVRHGQLRFDIASQFSQKILNKFVELFKEKLETLVHYLVKQEQTMYHINDFSHGFEPYVIYDKNTNNSININASKKILFLLPPGDGGAESYANNLIPKLSQSQYTIVAFNNYFMHIRNQMHVENSNTNIHYEFLAAFYIQHIKKIQPQGPYHLSGWSFGGTLAFEIARQLASSGDEIHFLGLIDAFFDYQKVSQQLNINHTVNNINWRYQPEILEENVSKRIKNMILFKANEMMAIDVAVEEQHKWPEDDQQKMRLACAHYWSTPDNYLSSIIENNYFKVIPLNANHNTWLHNDKVIDDIIFHVNVE